MPVTRRDGPAESRSGVHRELVDRRDQYLVDLLGGPPDFDPDYEIPVDVPVWELPDDVMPAWERLGHHGTVTVYPDDTVTPQEGDPTRRPYPRCRTCHERHGTRGYEAT